MLGTLSKAAILASAHDGDSERFISWDDQQKSTTKSVDQSFTGSFDGAILRNLGFAYQLYGVRPSLEFPIEAKPEDSSQPL